MRQCITHHYACDCREAQFERTLFHLAKYKAALVEISVSEELKSSKLAKRVLKDVRVEVRDERKKREGANS